MTTAADALTAFAAMSDDLTPAGVARLDQDTAEVAAQLSELAPATTAEAVIAGLLIAAPALREELEPDASAKAQATLLRVAHAIALVL